MIKFVNKFKYACLAVVIVLIAAVAGYYIHGGLNLDISFQGGTQIQVQVADEKTDNEALAAKIEDYTQRPANVQNSKSFDINVQDDKYFVVVKMATDEALTDEQLTEVQNIIKENANVVDALDAFEVQNVEPSIGSELLTSGLKGLVIALVLMILYIAVRFSKISGLQAGCSTVVALLIDALLVFAVYVIFHLAFNETFIAAILTIIGYSINDKIIIFDRIRELTITGRRKLAHSEIVDLAINETLPRTINTGISTLIALIITLIMSLFFNIPSITEFAFPLILGTLIGTLTSMYIATPIYAGWMESSTKRK